MLRPFERLIIALDLPNRADVVAMARQLRGEVGMVKIGLEAFVAHGPDLVREIRDLGLDIFLDLKLHDIPRTAGAAAAQTARLGVRLLTVHAAGGEEMVRAVRQEASPDTQVIAVTVLTSLDDAAVHSLGFPQGTIAFSQRLGEVARQGGADGLVCSAHELAVLATLGGSRVVPGVRPSAGSSTPPGDDQKRVATPTEAVRAGATWLVVGRPVLQAPNPVDAARAIVAELSRIEV